MPPQVMAEAMPVLASTTALRLRPARYFVLAVRPLAPVSRFSACVAMRLLPVPTGVPKSVTGRFALAAVARLVMRAVALPANLASRALITFLDSLCVSIFVRSSTRIPWKKSANLVQAALAVGIVTLRTKSSTKQRKWTVLGGG